MGPDDLNRKAGPHEPLPDLVVNGYYLLGKDWLETASRWADAGLPTPPVMITGPPAPGGGSVSCAG